jgi:hypothetical protein
MAQTMSAAIRAEARAQGISIMAWCRKAFMRALAEDDAAKKKQPPVRSGADPLEVTIAHNFAHYAKCEVEKGNRCLANSYLDMVNGMIYLCEELGKTWEAERMREIMVQARRELREARGVPA